jgi:large subunit ribosomal protein L29
MAKEKKTFSERSVDDLKSLYKEYSTEIFNLRNELAVSRKLEKPHLLKEKKKDRARVLTALRTKK